MLQQEVTLMSRILYRCLSLWRAQAFINPHCSAAGARVLLLLLLMLVVIHQRPKSIRIGGPVPVRRARAG